MKVRSRKLYEYLFQAGVLNGSEDAITHAKKRYRTLYKKQWRKRKCPRKEIRIELTIKQFQAVKFKARAYDLRHTSYARQILLASVEIDKYFVPYKDKLDKVLQLVSMAAIESLKQSADPQHISVCLTQAETELLNYLQYAP